jgi:hypothetical protein
LHYSNHFITGTTAAATTATALASFNAATAAASENHCYYHYHCATSTTVSGASVTTATASFVSSTDNPAAFTTYCSHYPINLTAALHGNIELMAYVLEQEPTIMTMQRQLKQLLYYAGSTNHLAAAQWLHAQGAPWPDVLPEPIFGRFRSSWSEATVAWARSEGCTSPLE